MAVLTQPAISCSTLTIEILKLYYILHRLYIDIDYILELSLGLYYDLDEDQIKHISKE